jgi:hypothetical protein
MRRWEPLLVDCSFPDLGTCQILGGVCRASFPYFLLTLN